MSVHYISAVWRLNISEYFPNNRSCSTIKLVLLKIADHANDEGIAYPSMTRIARECEISTRWAIRTIAMLEAAGLLEVDRTEGRINRYRLTLPQCPPVNSSSPVNYASRVPVNSNSRVEPVNSSSPVNSNSRVPVNSNSGVPVNSSSPEPSYNRQGYKSCSSSFNNSHAQKLQNERKAETVVERVARIMDVPVGLFPLQADSYLRRFIKPEHTDDDLRRCYEDWLAKGHSGIVNGRAAYWWVKWLKNSRASPSEPEKPRIKRWLDDPEYVKAVLSVEVVSDESSANA